MSQKRIVLVGDTPGTYVCAIYLHTANIPVTVVRTAVPFEYDCKLVAGLPGITKEQFLENCYQQVNNMGILVIRTEEAEIATNGSEYTITTSSNTWTADILLVDRNVYGLAKSECLFSIEEEVEAGEAILLAGAGCRIAFYIKELVG